MCVIVIYLIIKQPCNCLHLFHSSIVCTKEKDIITV